MLRRSAIVLAFFIAPALFGQTSGSLSGKITDDAGAALPGVTVEVKSPSLQGARIAVTDAFGEYRFPLLPPGMYTVTFELNQWATGARKDVQVLLGKEVSVDATMRPVSS